MYSKDLSTSYLLYDILGEAARFSMMTGRRDSLSLIGFLCTVKTYLHLIYSMIFWVKLLDFL